MVIKGKDMGLGKSSMGTYVLNCTEKDCSCLHQRQEVREGLEDGKVMDKWGARGKLLPCYFNNQRDTRG